MAEITMSFTFADCVFTKLPKLHKIKNRAGCFGHQGTDRPSHTGRWKSRRMPRPLSGDCASAALIRQE
jgi:hypothetical protein